MKKIILLSILLLIVSMGCVSAEDVNSTDSDIQSSDFSGNFQELQDLIDDTEESYIELEDDYNGSGMISIEKDLVINGNGHYIDANSQSCILFISDCTVLLYDIKFYNAYEDEYCGGAIYSDAKLGIQGCEFYNNYAYEGGGAIASYDELYVEDSLFVNNIADYGASIFAKNDVWICNSYFYDNKGKVEIIDYYDKDSSNSGTLYLENNTMETSYPWPVLYEGDTPIESPTYLIFTDKTYEKAENVKIAYFVDNYGNEIKIDSINTKIYKGTSLVDSKTIDVDDENGYLYTNTNLKSGKYTTTGSVSSKYASNCTVMDGTLTISSDSQDKATPTVTTTSKVDGNQVTLTATLNPSAATGTVTFNVNNKDYAVSVKSGKATKTLTDLADGTYKVKTTYGGDSEYKSAAAKDITFTINTEPPASETISAPAVEKYFGGSERFVVTLKDSSGKAIANGNVKITLNGQTYDRTTGEAGTTSVAINLPAGNYEVIVEYNGEKTKSSVKVKSTLEGNDLTKMFRNSTQYYIKVLDSNGNPLTGKKVKFNINGVFYERNIDANGYAKMNINLNPETYIITAENPANGEMHSNKVTVLSTIVENHDITKYYKNATQYTLRLLDAQGKPVGKGQKVKFNINGVFYERTSDANGYAKMNINLAPDNYIITADYNGCKVSNHVRVLSVLSGKDVTMTHGDKSKYEVKLVDGQGNPYSGQKIKLNINGVFYDRTTDANGMARLEINLRPSTYIITASYNGYSTSNTIKVNPRIDTYDCSNGHKVDIPSTASINMVFSGDDYGYEITYEDGYGELAIESSSNSVSDMVNYLTYYGAKYMGYYGKWVAVNNIPLVQMGASIPCYYMFYKDGKFYSIASDDLNIAKRIAESFR